jgi:feruloyl esterase
MGRFSSYGFATMSTDTGHNSTAFDGSWGLNAPESLVDWGHRAMHGSVELSKSIINSYYNISEGIRYSYYASCSTGGRQGLREIQLHPDDFDGISVGAPGMSTDFFPPSLNVL